MRENSGFLEPLEELEKPRDGHCRNGIEKYRDEDEIASCEGVDAGCRQSRGAVEENVLELVVGVRMMQCFAKQKPHVDSVGICNPFGQEASFNVFETVASCLGVAVPNNS